MTELTVPSGAQVVINTAPWEDAIALQQAIFYEVGRGAGLNLSTFMMVAASPVVYAAVMKCAIRSTYNNEKITSQTFKTKESREDYIPIITAVVKENLGPLEAGLFSLLSEITEHVKKQAAQGADQKSESTTTANL